MAYGFGGVLAGVDDGVYHCCALNVVVLLWFVVGVGVDLPCMGTEERCLHSLLID